jgi:hypothetical protein
MVGYIFLDRIDSTNCIRYGTLYSYLDLDKYSLETISIAYSLDQWERNRNLHITYTANTDFPDKWKSKAIKGKTLLKNYGIVW